MRRQSASELGSWSPAESLPSADKGSADMEIALHISVRSWHQSRMVSWLLPRRRCSKHPNHTARSKYSSWGSSFRPCLDTASGSSCVTNGAPAELTWDRLMLDDWRS